MRPRLILILALLLLAGCAGPLDAPLPSRAALPTAALAGQPTANPAVIDKPILDDLAATAQARGRQPVSAPVATPQPTSAPRHSAPRAAPTRLVIEAIRLDRPLVPVGLDAGDLPIVPKHDAGWFTGSASPGQGDNVVLWGHALRFRDSPGIPAPFGRLNELKPGSGIVLYDSAGAAHRYVVRRQVWATPDQVDYILPQGREQLTMVSCIGKQVIATDGTVLSMSHRLITIAEPATEQEAQDTAKREG